MKSEIFLPLVFTLTVAVAEGEVQKRHCKPGYFVDTSIRGCKKCSVCPQNQITRRPCDDTNDVFCAYFTEFNEFNQHQELTLLSNTTATDPNQEGQQNSMSSEIGWRKLSMALVIVLSLGLVLLSAGILTFYFWRKRQAAAKEVSTVVYERDPLTSDVSVNPPEPTFRGETTSQLEAATFVPQPSTSGERKRSPKKNEYVKLFRPTEKSSGEIDLDLEERMVGFVPSNTQDTAESGPSATVNI